MGRKGQATAAIGNMSAEEEEGLGNSMWIGDMFRTEVPLAKLMTYSQEANNKRWQGYGENRFRWECKTVQLL